MDQRRAIIIAAALIALASLTGLAIAFGRSSPQGEKKSAVPTSSDLPVVNDTPQRPLDSVPAVIEPEELTKAHEAMREYLTVLGTYTYQTERAAWSAKARALTDGSSNMKDLTSLPTGRTWAVCEQTRCSSTATAELTRDTVMSNAPVEGSGRSVTTLASTTVTLHERQKTTQKTAFQLTATYTQGEWKISGLQLAGVGDAGTSEAG
ncbi:hypothetical protein [Streptomyces niveus]|uniref:hypothetical protein n=1 Tax=Streptomyces niveus TaxID=193462 RepID=UPI0034163AB7